jgi:hypothetical protein
MRPDQIIERMADAMVRSLGASSLADLSEHARGFWRDLAREAYEEEHAPT